MATAKLMGLKEVQEAIKRYDVSVRGALRAALYQEGTAIDALSVTIVPVDFGRLRATHFVTVPTQGKHPSCEIGYGTDYALYVHENTKAKHNPPTSAKYLQKPMEQRIRGYRTRLAKRTRNNLAAGIDDVFAGTIPQRPNDPGPQTHRNTDRKPSGTQDVGRGKRGGLTGGKG